MNRGYEAQQFIDICKKIKSKNPNFRITTDAIVGFPTETEEDFQKTKELLKECDIEMVYIGKYSPRPNTAASKLQDNVPLETKKEREKELRDIVNRIRQKKHTQLVGTKLPILMVTENKGISYYNHEILSNKSYSPGQIYDLEIKDFTRAGLKC
jgi:tRNA A37 methylthiotransferase MiaB